MDKVLVIIPDNNKGKYIAKGYADAFRSLSYFVIERKLYDLKSEEIMQFKPDIIFTFWSQMKTNASVKVFFTEYKCDKTTFINVAEYKDEILSDVQNLNKAFCFSSDSTGKNKILPAVSAESYKRKFSGYKYLISFSGNPAYKEREKILSKIIYNFGIINIFCRSFDFYKSVDEIYKNKFLDDKYLELYRESYRGYVESQKELSYIYSHSKINIDLPSEKPKPINYRCFEILSSGGFLIAPYNKTLIKYLDDGSEFETFEKSDELIDKIRFYLQNANIGFLIASKGKRKVVSNYTLGDRLKVILKVVYGKDFSSR